MANAVVGAGNMPQANNYSTALGQARAVDIIAQLTRQGKTTVDPRWGCILVTSGLRPDGYAHTKRWTNVDLANRAAGQILPRNSQTNFLLHRVAYLAQTGRDVIGVSSHQCLNRNCLSHVLDETQAVNVSRSRCQGCIVCPRHNTVLYDFCQHVPQCLREPLMGGCCLGEDSSMDESVEGGRVIPGSQELEGALSDFISMLGDSDSLPGSQYLALERANTANRYSDDEDPQQAGEDMSILGDESHPVVIDSSQPVEDSSLPLEMETSLLAVDLNADEDLEPSSSPPRLPTRRRAPLQPVQESSSSQLPQNPSSSQMGSFIVGDGVVIFDDTSTGPDDDSDS
jgi:Zinc-binding loop region of homing endonuclease